MFGYISDFDRSLQLMEQLRRRMDRVFEDFDDERGFDVRAGSFPLTNFYDDGQAYVLEAEVPGMTEKDINISVTQDVLTISGEYKAQAPEGYSVHRKERPAVKFSRSYTLPAKVDPQQVAASVKDGILSVSLQKAPEVRPRQITVRAS
jgi:HSP20 family protein